MLPVADLHCDLLCYLEGDVRRSAFDPDVRCSIPQLKEGGVTFQTMAIFTETNSDSVKKGMRQADIFKNLASSYSGHFQDIRIQMAIENASSIADEKEPLEIGLERLNTLHEDLGVAYISLTWNTENRFGGGAHTRVGLKEDGKHLLCFLSGKNIALDLSHTSDILAYEALNFIDQKSLKVPVLASHSNFRTVTSVARNLPDELVKEIFYRKGLVGLTFVRDFIGREDAKKIIRHLEHGLKLGGADHICLGADFYFGGDVSPAFRKLPEQMFFSDFNSSAAYPALFNLWQSELNLPMPLLKAIAYQNLLRFFD